MYGCYVNLFSNVKMASSRHPSGFSENDKSALSLLQLESMSDEDLADLFDQTLYVRLYLWHPMWNF